MSSIENMGSTEFSSEMDEGLAPPAPTWWCVSFYMYDRAYGGPEEGGWYYDCGVPITDARLVKYTRIFIDEDKADAYATRLKRLLAVLNRNRPDTSSVLSEGQYGVAVDPGQYPTAFPAERPYYC